MKKIKIMWYRFHEKHVQKPKLRFVNWFHVKCKAKYCWADCVAWAFDACRFNPFRISRGTPCQNESIDHADHLCYCGGWFNGKHWSKLKEFERHKIIKDREGDGSITNDMPF